MAENLTVQSPGAGGAPAEPKTEKQVDRGQQELDRLRGLAKARSGKNLSDEQLKAIVSRRKAKIAHQTKVTDNKAEFESGQSKEAMTHKANDARTSAARTAGTEGSKSVKDGLTNEERENVRSNPKAGPKLPPTQSKAATPEQAKEMLSKIFEHVMVDGEPVDMKAYAETLQKRPPTQIPKDPKAQKSQGKDVPQRGQGPQRGTGQPQAKGQSQQTGQPQKPGETPNQPQADPRAAGQSRGEPGHNRDVPGQPRTPGQSQAKADGQQSKLGQLGQKGNLGEAAAAMKGKGPHTTTTKGGLRQSPSPGRPGSGMTPVDTSRAGPAMNLGGAKNIAMQAKGGGFTRLAIGTKIDGAGLDFNAGGGIETHSSFDGMNFNWDAFFTLFFIKSQKDLNLWRKMMRELKRLQEEVELAAHDVQMAMFKMKREMDKAQKLAAATKAVSGMAESVAKAKQNQAMGKSPGQARQGIDELLLNNQRMAGLVDAQGNKLDPPAPLLDADGNSIPQPPLIATNPDEQEMGQLVMTPEQKESMQTVIDEGTAEDGTRTPEAEAAFQAMRRYNLGMNKIIQNGGTVGQLGLMRAQRAALERTGVPEGWTQGQRDAYAQQLDGEITRLEADLQEQLGSSNTGTEAYRNLVGKRQSWANESRNAQGQDPITASILMYTSGSADEALGEIRAQTEDPEVLQEMEELFCMRLAQERGRAADPEAHAAGMQVFLEQNELEGLSETELEARIAEYETAAQANPQDQEAQNNGHTAAQYRDLARGDGWAAQEQQLDQQLRADKADLANVQTQLANNPTQDLLTRQQTLTQNVANNTKKIGEVRSAIASNRQLFDMAPQSIREQHGITGERSVLPTGEEASTTQSEQSALMAQRDAGGRYHGVNSDFATDGWDKAIEMGTAFFDKVGDGLNQATNSKMWQEAVNTAVQGAISMAKQNRKETESRIQGGYMQAQGMINQLIQLLGMSRSR